MTMMLRVNKTMHTCILMRAQEYVKTNQSRIKEELDQNNKSIISGFLNTQRAIVGRFEKNMHQLVKCFGLKKFYNSYYIEMRLFGYQ
jgi:hypothetical protein